MVAEGVVLLGVEHFQQGRARVAAPVRADLVDLVEHEDGIAGARTLDGLDDAARHGADVGAAVAANLGFVPHAAQAHAGEFATQGAGDALAQAGFADAGRADKAQDRAHGLLDLAFVPFGASMPRSLTSLRTARYSRMRSLTFCKS